MEDIIIEPTIEVLVEQAKEGNKAALEAIVRRVQDQVYNLALRMLWQPADAEDATQEILIKVITHLSQFRQESAFTTWVYRIATNYLLTTRQRRAELRQVTFEEFGAGLEARMDVEALMPPDVIDQHLLVEETQIRCTFGMLICLDREQRVTYVLGEILGVSSDEGAYIMETTPANFRKRLSRARVRMRSFMQSNCGLVNPANPCRCERQVGYKIRHEKLEPGRLLFADAPASPYSKSLIKERVAELQKLDRTVAIFRTHPAYAVPHDFVDAIKQLLESGKFEVLN